MKRHVKRREIPRRGISLGTRLLSRFLSRFCSVPRQRRGVFYAEDDDAMFHCTLHNDAVTPLPLDRVTYITRSYVLFPVSDKPQYPRTKRYVTEA